MNTTGYGPRVEDCRLLYDLHAGGPSLAEGRPLGRAYEKLLDIESGYAFAATKK